MFIPLEQVVEWLLVYKYFVLFPIMVLEGPIITIISGFLSSLEILNIYLAFVIVVVADLVGDFIYYSLGRWGRTGFVDKWGKYIGITKEKVEKLENHFKKHTKKTLVIGKISHAIGGPILFAAGVAHVKVSTFFWFNFIATLPKTSVLLLIGYYFGQAYLQLNDYLDYVAYGIIAILVFYFLIKILIRKIRARYSSFLQKVDKFDINKIDK